MFLHLSWRLLRLFNPCYEGSNGRTFKNSKPIHILLKKICFKFHPSLNLVYYAIGFVTIFSHHLLYYSANCVYHRGFYLKNCAFEIAP